MSAAATAVSSLDTRVLLASNLRTSRVMAVYVRRAIKEGAEWCTSARVRISCKEQMSSSEGKRAQWAVAVRQ
jgi:hypothetical protein